MRELANVDSTEVFRAAMDEIIERDFDPDELSSSTKYREISFRIILFQL